MGYTRFGDQEAMVRVILRRISSTNRKQLWEFSISRSDLFDGNKR
jgi:hypothetical protein